MAAKQWITTSLHWGANLLLVVVCCHFVQIYPASLIWELGLGTLVAIIGPVLVLMHWRRRRQLAFNPTVVFGGLTLITLGLVITIAAIDDLPVIVNQRSIYAIHLGPFYRALHHALTAYITVWTLISRRRSAKAEMGLVAILVYSALNGGFFHIIGDRFALLGGLSLTTALIHLADRAGESEHEPPPNGKGLPPLGLSVLMFLLGAGLATVTSLYIHNSLNHWLRLGNWVLVYFLIVNVVRDRSQIERLILVALTMAVIVAVTGLGGVVGYASRMGWSNALQARLWVVEKPHNGVATFAVTYITLGAGLFLTWASRRRRALLGVAVILLLLCAFLTYSRSGGMGLFCGLAVLLFLNRTGRIFSLASSYLSPLVKGRRWALALALLLPLLPITAALLIRLQQNTLTSRLYIWKAVLNVIWHRPLLGVGLNNHLIPAFADILSHKGIEIIKRVADTHSHNLLLEIGEGMGLVGVGLFLWLLVATARYSLSAMRQASAPCKQSLLLALCAASVALLTPQALSLSLSEATLLPISFWILLGLIVAVSKIEFQDDKGERGEQPTAEPTELPGRFGQAERWRSMLLACLILIGVLLGVARPLVARVAQRHGMAVWRKGERSEAARALNLAIMLQPLDAELYAALGDVVVDEEIVEAYQRASALRPYYAPYHTRLGWLHWAYNRFSQALVEFEKAAALDWYGLDGGEHQSDLGLVYAAAGEKEQALEAFRKAVLLDPASISSPDWQLVETGVALDAAYTRYAETRRVDGELLKRIVYQLGRSGADPAAFGSAGKPQIALEDVVDGLLVEAEQAAESDKEWAIRALSKLSELCLEWGLEQELTRTLQVFERLAEPGTPDEAEFHMWRGVSYQERGQLQKAQAEFQAALLIADRAEYHNLLGMTYFRQRMLQEGIVELEQAARFWDPGIMRLYWWPLYWEDLARAYRQAGRSEDAIAAYEMAQFFRFSVHPHLQVQLAIGETYREHGDYVNEIDAYVRAVEILSARGELGPADRDLLRKLATHAAISYQRQGLTVGEALTAHESLIRVDGRIERTYLEFFREEVEGRLP